VGNSGGRSGWRQLAGGEQKVVLFGVRGRQLTALSAIHVTSVFFVVEGISWTMSTAWSKAVDFAGRKPPVGNSNSSEKLQSIMQKFAGSQALPEDLRNKCMAAVIENELVSMNSHSLMDASPGRLELYEQVQHIRRLDNLGQNQKDAIVQELSANYVGLKTGGASFQPHQPMRETVKRAPKTLFPPSAMLRNTPQKSMVCVGHNANKIEKWAHGLSRPAAEKIWDGSVPCITFPNALAAMVSIDPCMTTIRTEYQKSSYIRELKCSIKDCTVRIKMVCSDASPYCPNAQLFQLNEHEGHQLRGWHGHYSDMCELKKTSRKGLPIHFRDMVDVLARDHALEPMQIWRKLTRDVQVLEEFLLSSNVLVYSKIKDQVLTRIKYVRRYDENKATLTYTSDIMSFKARHRLSVPYDFHAQPILAEEHLLLVARNLVRSGNLNVVKGRDDSRPHRDMVVLDYDNLGVDLSERYTALMKNRNDAPREAMVVFTSLALLSTICCGIALDWEICLSADGTHNIGANDYKLIAIGVIHITSHGVKRLHPLVYAWCPGELEVCVLVALHHVKMAVWELFGIEPHFRGGMISDRSEVYVNAFKSVFPGNPVLQCYAHIIRKFIVDGKREHNGAYKCHVNGNITWLQITAKEDVSNLRLCRSDEMFRKGIKLVREAWLEDGQEKVWETFSNSYLNDPDYSKWRYGVSGIPGCVPQNQSNERITLETKGCSLFQGTIRTGRSFEAMMNVEFPTLISVNSTERVGLSRSIPMMDESFITHKERVLLFFNSIDYSVDVSEYKNGFLVNCFSSIAKPINDTRIEEYERTLSGDFEFSHKERKTFFGRVNGLCFVKLQQPKDDNGAAFYSGCFHYFDKCWCMHAAIIQYKASLKIMGNKIPTRKMTKVRRIRRSQMWIDTQLHNIEKRRKALETHSASLEHDGVLITQTQSDGMDD
jgi:hypothetical protein